MKVHNSKLLASSLFCLVYITHGFLTPSLSKFGTQSFNHQSCKRKIAQSPYKQNNAIKMSGFSLEKSDKAAEAEHRGRVKFVYQVPAEKDGPDVTERFDTKSMGMPVVHRYMNDEGDRWVMWYHGRPTAFDDDLVNLSTGYIGRAESTDGIHWTAINGPDALMSVLGPNEDQWWSFDAAHVGLGDVTIANEAMHKVETKEAMYFMYYFGGTYEEMDLTKFGLENPSVQGMKGMAMKIGCAISTDGMHWSRLEGDSAVGACVELGKMENEDFDPVFVGWPQVLNHKGDEFRMYYSTLNPRLKMNTVGMATSNDGLLFKKHGQVFTGSGVRGAFDARGVSRRHIIYDGESESYKMFYEGTSDEGKHSIGLATSTDGLTWEVEGDGPVFSSDGSSPGSFDAGGVSSPRVIDLGGGRFRMYYVGVPEGGSQDTSGPSIGIAECTNRDFHKWERVQVE